MQSKQHYYALISYLLVPLAGFSTDVYLPSLPGMMAAFHVDKSLTQLTLTAFVFAMGLAQLIAGPLCDAWGRKRLIVASLLLQAVTVISIIFSSSIYSIITARFFQGIAAAFMLVPARAILSDIFSGDALKKQFNYLAIVFALGPILAPFIGGYMEHYFGWQANFYFLLSYQTLCFGMVVFMLAETLKAPRPFSIKHLWKNYQQLLQHITYRRFTLLACLLFAGSFLFSATGPFVFQVMLKLSPIVYGYIALGAGGCWFLGNIVSRLTFHMNRKKKALGLSSIALCAALSMLVLNLFLPANIYLAALPPYVLIFCSAMIFPITMGECLSLFPEMAASANACFFSMTWMAAGGYSTIAALLNTHSLIALAAVFCVVTLLMQGATHLAVKSFSA